MKTHPPIVFTLYGVKTLDSLMAMATS